MLKEALKSVTIIFNCAGKSFEYLHDGICHTDEYWHDNTDATEILIEVMIELKISFLIHISDAYANLPTGDNFGLSEQIHSGIPKNFMLGIYGQSKTYGELYVRNAASNNQINALILRPTFVYGEGEKHLLGSALKLCSLYGGIPYIQDMRRGFHQYLYAGNMAAIMERAMTCLKENPKYYNSEVVICMDCTRAKRFVDFMEPFLQVTDLKRVTILSYIQTYFVTIFYEILNKFAPNKCLGRLTWFANRFINSWTIGFSNRKLRLLLDFIPPYDQAEAVEQCINWLKQRKIRNE
ncbi:unnamed protein product [Thelazia callipaeda]|uniref:3Beta_HSD domain-containing protein n=1 Tax=Thelazia callipaeda TaxID=103827 RepID=A0A0N5CSH4_THECL|nr:unnamed protein product [Thelazia callipaeda]